MRYVLLIILLMPLSGCLGTTPDACWTQVTPSDAEVQHAATPVDFAANRDTTYAKRGFDGTFWPDLSGEHLTIIDHGAFDFAFGPAKEAFENLTGATVEHIAADDAGTALQLVADDLAAGGHAYDVIYGIDNVLMGRAEEAGLLEPYTPLLGDRVPPKFRFIPTDRQGAWLATPVDHGYIAINIDDRAGLQVEDLGDLVAHAGTFVTEDPRFSSPGLGFLVATVATYGEDCYLGYWQDLFENGATITTGWTEAYVDRFSGGYGEFTEGTTGDKPIVTSYTTSPAYELFYEATHQNDVLLAPQSTFQQIQTMAIIRDTPNLEVAQAWIEFSLTEHFQTLAAEYNAIYPVTRSPIVEASVENVYQGNDPVPGSFIPAQLDSDYLGDNIDTWVRDWADLYDRHRA